MISFCRAAIFFLYGIPSIESFSDCLMWFRKAVAIDIWLVSTGLNKDPDGLKTVKHRGVLGWFLL